MIGLGQEGRNLASHGRPRQHEQLGIAFYTGSIDDAADLTISRALEGLGGYAILCNVHVLASTRGDASLRSVLQSAWEVFPDGAPIAWLLRRCGAPDAERVAGPDLMPRVIDQGRSRELRHVLYGSTPEVVRSLRTKIRRSFPGALIVEAISPPPGGEDDPALLTRIVEARPHVVWVALGAPKQEFWLWRHATSLRPALCLGVGAAFDFHAGTKSRAPDWMQSWGLEWLHRLLTEPRRLAWRYATTNAVFIVSAMGVLARQPASRLRAIARQGNGRT